MGNVSLMATGVKNAIDKLSDEESDFYDKLAKQMPAGNTTKIFIPWYSVKFIRQVYNPRDDQYELDIGKTEAKIPGNLERKKWENYLATQYGGGRHLKYTITESEPVFAEKSVPQENPKQKSTTLDDFAK